MGADVQSYVRRSFGVEAVEWDGKNRQPVIDLIQKYCGPDAGPRFSRDEDPHDPYNIVQFYCCEDHEVDPGRMIVFLKEPENPDYPGSFFDIRNAKVFQRQFDPADAVTAGMGTQSWENGFQAGRKTTYRQIVEALGVLQAVLDRRRYFNDGQGVRRALEFLKTEIGDKLP